MNQDPSFGKRNEIGRYHLDGTPDEFSDFVALRFLGDGPAAQVFMPAITR